MTKHVILVPGFAGFDVLGELHYYAGITDVFRRSPHFGPGRSIDYFDNFPTASVVQRADRLRVFLGKKWARGEIQAGDEVTLIGHSTGALDIRRLLCDLRCGFGEPLSWNVSVDGLVAGVPAAALRGVIRRVVFLSAPHFGTSIGNFFHQVRAQIMLAAQNAGQAVSANQKIPFGTSQLVAAIVGDGSCQLFDAVADALRDTDQVAAAPKQASEREALYNLLLWLDHISHDLDALSDLRSFGSARPDASGSPAFFDAALRAQEIADYSDPSQPIELQCYATRVSRPPPLGLPGKALLGLVLGTGMLAGATAPLLGLLSGVPGASVFSAVPTLAGAGAAWSLFREHPGALFALLHGICGARSVPFPDLRGQPDAGSIALGGIQPLEADPAQIRFETARIDPADNDGIVNTMSMLWPHDPTGRLICQHLLVEADHADIIGHHTHRAAAKLRPGGRHNEAYDIFESGSGFGQPAFEAIWQNIMDFAL